VIKTVVGDLERNVGGVWFIDEFEEAFNGHRFCEVENDPNYHKSPIDPRTWFIHYDTPYDDPSITPTSAIDFFKAVDAVLIPPKDGLSTEDQINAVGGDYKQINPAYTDYDSMTAALKQLAADNPDAYGIWPVTWLRVMHPKGSGYEQMSNEVINKFIAVQAAVEEIPEPEPTPEPEPEPEPTKVMMQVLSTFSPSRFRAHH
jgi:hypothetical protein